ncbi:Pentatricopeptide repeat [Macleaya cordata]|uniref:Pentatricopeptide repeat n=1 Tax=Macleaya cordata TaxID=56857 RepID=A0A200PZG6_MACCD|nr:Pentatricopeptide repeat [Macleaya cordata]
MKSIPLKIIQAHRPNFKSLTKIHKFSSNHHLLQTQKSHAHHLKLGISTTESDLIRSYCESKSFSDARILFDETSEWDLVSATTVIGHFARHDRHKDAISLFSRLLFLNIKPNEFTFGTVIHSSTTLRVLRIGEQFHACAFKLCLQSNVYVGSSILNLYVKLSTIEEARKAFDDTSEPNVVSYTTLICGYLKNERFEDALQLFQDMPEKNVVSWNAMIGGYSQMGHTEEAVNLFVEMHREGLLPNQSTFPCVFSAAANIAAIGMGKSFHACALKILGSSCDVFVGNSLISFYAKCGCMEDSLLIFNKLHDRNIVSWNAVICGYAQNGRGKEALEFFEKMQVSGLRPNSVTLLCLLLACNHTGLVDEAFSYFNLVKTEDPNLLKPEHYACMVDLLSRSGRFREAENFLQDLPFDPGIGFWKALLGGCQIHSNTELAEFAAQRIQDLDPEDASSYVMISNANSAAGRWKNVSMIRKEMREKEMTRIPGCSWIEIKSKVHVFVTGDKRHVQVDEIYVVLRYFFEHLREIPDSKLLQNIELLVDHQKELRN